MMLQKTVSFFSQPYILVTCLTEHKCFVIWVFILTMMTSQLPLLKLRHVGWEFSGYGWFMRFLLAWSTDGVQSLTIIVSTNESFCHNNFEIQQWYVIITFNVNSMTVYKCHIYEIKKYSQVKAILTFTFESASLKLDDVRTRNSCFACLSPCSSHYGRYPLISSIFVANVASE